MYCEFSVYCLRVVSYELYLVFYGVGGENSIMARIIFTGHCGLKSNTPLKIWTASKDPGRKSGGQAHIIFHGAVVVILVVSHLRII